MKIKNFLLITLLMSLSLVFAGCDDDDTSNPCGNGEVDTEEECDGVNLNGNSCSDLNPADYGTLACNADCTFDTTLCVTASCGDGILNGTEECDGDDFGGTDCTDHGSYSGGTLSCNPELCTLNLSECIAQCNVDGFFEDCNVMGGVNECCDINDMQADCKAYFQGIPAGCFQSCGGDDDCGWNYKCEAGIENHCLWEFCGPEYNGTALSGSCTLGDKDGFCYPYWSAKDTQGICFENGTLTHGDACFKGTALNPVDNVTGIDPDTQCENGFCYGEEDEEDGTCVDICDPIEALAGNDTCPTGWNCINFSSLDTDDTSDSFLFREADTGECRPMTDGIHPQLDTGLVTCDLMTGLTIKGDAACDTGFTCKPLVWGSLLGFCFETQATPLAEGDECVFSQTLAQCAEGTDCTMAFPTSDATADWEINQCNRICNANATDANVACEDITTTDGTPFVCLSMSRFYTDGNTLPYDSSVTPGVFESSPTSLGYCVPPRE
ncbi:hypothetical protein KKF84_01680 [Myxococcota bacterium]|nr:hypothetical protein [Myxococcota bacterium]MBU1533996.1 hypothetical protein [Myxococcota bacterium]